jgi:hypothetical protein
MRKQVHHNGAVKLRRILPVLTGVERLRRTPSLTGVERLRRTPSLTGVERLRPDPLGGDEKPNQHLHPLAGDGRLRPPQPSPGGGDIWLLPNLNHERELIVQWRCGRPQKVACGASPMMMSPTRRYPFPELFDLRVENPFLYLSVFSLGVVSRHTHSFFPSYPPTSSHLLRLYTILNCLCIVNVITFCVLIL